MAVKGSDCMGDILKQQYEWIISNRRVVLNFLEGIPLHKLHENVPGFGHGSIIRTYIHMADCYRYWIEFFSLKRDLSDYKDTSDDDIEHADVQKVRKEFEKLDEIVFDFIDKYKHRLFEDIINVTDGEDPPMKASPLVLITHATTHEFHHRGQILSMIRHLGFTSEDARLGSLFS